MLGFPVQVTHVGTTELKWGLRIDRILTNQAVNYTQEIKICAKTAITANQEAEQLPSDWQ
jgi:hypothetical protein